MDFSKLVHLEKPVHIVAAIERGASFGGDIWQTGLVHERNVFQIVQIQLDAAHDKVILRTNSLTTVEQDYPIFIRLRYRNILFRLEPYQFKVCGDKLICIIPKDVKALAMRSSERFVLPFELDISLSLKRFARTIKEQTPELEVRIIDVSESGIGILISGPNKEFLKPYDHFWIKAIDHKMLNRDIFGTVLYVAPKGYYLRRQDVRVGLSLNTPLSWDTFSSLKKKCRIILSA
ncbi:MAG: hypothetical protein H0V66_12910 [Bdellovibrionales bacterium]|nr:hypothetical protein [Bdellovibrionales bacterium]